MDIPPRTARPRVTPLEVEQWEPKLREQMVAGRPVEMGESAAPVFNIFKTLANHPALARGFLRWGNQVLFRSTLPAREREIVILRVGWLCRATYEWHHHVTIGRDHAGLGDEDFAWIKAGPDAPGPADTDRALLRAVDELVGDHFIGDATWAELVKTWSTEQVIDLVFAVGNYTMVSMALNSFGVALEPGYGGPD
ncbi:carboxymuconolactone decarboxylase family protein [Sphingosinicellaceae bacterium]|nr:carboxymuconolactone decarboxylase family protein [Sphingosinicellaceae bacterium]